MHTNRLLVFSSSRAGNGGYLETALAPINNFLGDSALTIAFIPFASVDADYEAYAAMVRSGLSSLPHTIIAVQPENAKATIENTDVIMVGGGNTFKLLHDIYDCQLLDIIRDKVNKGTPYIGWSAGSNITGPGIGTTNDMPVIAPKSFNALGLLPFQINPHYTNVKPAGHHGETRDQRLEEFMQMNPGLPIVALPEGTYLRLEGAQLQFSGNQPGMLFYWDENGKAGKREIVPGEDLSFLL
ncbi:dipeptidase PepE [Ferruginibacter paludis]|uniref:dipeptidase PepE n=1 Tax=Ferruginibacter paludis TaxID=1310417 RepID=UPI0025B318BF|nr:dipeptidase PepE [Ferruginibacter paludis]MDN3659146.1 dipeptidase PepE [Ferruginibacter paludis]